MPSDQTQTTDLVATLRSAFQRVRYGNGVRDYLPEGDLLDVAADEIERLRAELEAAAADIAMLIQKETDAANAPPPVPKAKP
jgi:hypothetical protein